MGGTLVLCTASVEEDVPPWRRASGLGWLTAEYAMLPRATAQRTPRERTGAGGRTQEIQRLIGRSVRAALNGFDFGPRTIRVDCDVLQADGGTRTASVTGAAVALADACDWIHQRHGTANPFGRLVAAVSVGLVGDEPRLDLEYEEDRAAVVDANVVMAEPDQYVEVQGTGEHGTFGRGSLDQLLALADTGLREIFAAQRRVLGR
jgi:ribonuclease PH